MIKKRVKTEHEIDLVWKKMLINPFVNGQPDWRRKIFFLKFHPGSVSMRR